MRRPQCSSVGGIKQHDMSVADPKPVVPKPKLRWFQFTLRTLLVVVTLASVLCSIGVCLGWGIALAIAVLAIFYGGGRVDRRRVSVVLALGPRCLPVLLKAIMLLLAACGGMTVLLLTGFALTPTGDPYSLLLRTMALMATLTPKRL